MSVQDDLRGIADRAHGELDSVHDFFEHSKIVWRSFQILVDKGHKVSAENLATGTRIDQDGLIHVAPKYTRDYLSTFTFRQFVSVFEIFLFNFLHRILLHNPWQFAKCQLEFEVVLKAGDRGEIISGMILKQLNKLKYDTLPEWFVAVEQVVNLGCPTADEIGTLAEVKAARDILEHNAGIVNQIYQRKAGKKARYVVGDHIEIEDTYYLESWRLMKKVVTDVTDGDGRHREVLFHVRVLHDQQWAESPFRMWYVAGFEGAKNRWSYGYAESNDGLEWRFPELGLVDIGGSKANNVVRAAAYCIFPVDHGPEFPVAAKRYTLLYTGGASFSATYSPDGLRWSDDPRNPLYRDQEGVMEDKLAGCWDPLRERYLLTTGYSGRPEDGFQGKPPFHRDGYRRMVGQMTSKDLKHWTPFRPIVVADPEEPGFWEFYGMKPSVRGTLYFGFLRVLRDDLPADERGPVHGIGWTELCTSRDGEHWTRHAGVFLDRDRARPTWEHAMAWVGDVVTVGDREFIYYGGYAKGHKVGVRQVGVATLPKDRFVSRDAGAERGTLRTPLFRWYAKQLTVNAKVDGELRVRVLAESGLPVPGFFWRDCEPIRGDSLRHAVRWKEDPETLGGRSVRLEFSLRDAELYAFDLMEE